MSGIEHDSFKPPLIETPRLLLRAVRPGDADDLFAYARDPEISRFTTWNAYGSVADAHRFLRIVLDQYRTGKIGLWGIEHRATQRFIGTIGLTGEGEAGAFVHGRAELAYALSREFWNQGLITEAAHAIVDFGFTSWDLNRIEARCLVPNLASARVMEKIGMKFEGILRQHIYVKGAFHDLKIYAILKNDWEKDAKFREPFASPR